MSDEFPGGLVTRHWSLLYASGFVFGRPMTFVPSLKSPRFFKSSTRSKRFRTFRFAVIVLAPFRLRCCDIDKFSCPGSENERPILRRQPECASEKGLLAQEQTEAEISAVRPLFRKQAENTLLVCLADAAFCNQARN